MDGIKPEPKIGGTFELILTIAFIIILFVILGWYDIRMNDLDAKIIDLQIELRNAEMYDAMVLFEKTKNGQRIQGLYYNTTFCLHLDRQSHAEVIEACSHEYLHWKEGSHFEGVRLND